MNDNYDSKESGESAIELEAAVRNLMNDCYSRDISKKISSAVHIKKGNMCMGLRRLWEMLVDHSKFNKILKKIEGFTPLDDELMSRSMWKYSGQIKALV